MDESPGRFPPPPQTPHASPPGWNTPGPAGFYPLDAGRVLQLTLSLFRFRRATFIGIALAFQIPVAIASGLLQALTVGAFLPALEITRDAARGEPVDVSEFVRLFPWDVVVLTWVVSIALGFVSYIGVGALTHAAGTSFSGGAVTVGASIRAALRRLAPLSVAFIIPFLATTIVALVGGTIAATLFMAGRMQAGILGFLALLVVVAIGAVVIFLSVRWALATAAVMIENAGGAAGLGRSWRLVAGSSWRVLGYALLFGLLVGLPVALMSYLVTAIVGSGVEETAVGLVGIPWQAFLSTFLIGVLAAVLAPITTIAMTVLYFDIRSRHGEEVPVPGQPARSVAEQQL